VATLPGQNNAYSFSATSGQLVSLTVSNTTFPLSCPWCLAASVEIVKPDGSVLVKRNWDIAKFIFVDATTIPDDGTYKVRLNPAKAVTGQATLTLYNVPPEDQGSITIGGTPADLNLTVPGQNAKLTFTGSQNDLVTVRTTNNTIGSVNVAVLRQDGTTTLKSTSSSATNFQLTPTLLPAAESYAMKVDPSGAATGTASVDICSIPIASAPSLPGTDTVWVEDSIPSGAGASGKWNWDTVQKASGAQSHSDPVAVGTHQHYFTNAAEGLTINPNDTLIAYVFINPCAPPQQVMLQWYESGSWEHRAYWGANLIGWGTDGTVSRFPMGALPPTGQWVRLEVPAASVGLVGKVVTGMAFALYDGHAWFDRAGKSQ
jgi:hypothetical protein